MSNTDFLQLRKDCEDFVKICGTFDKFDKADSLLPKHSKILIIGVSYVYNLFVNWVNRQSFSV